MDRLVVITALENCIGSGPCNGCPFDATLLGTTNFPDCMVSLQKEALQLIRNLTEPTVYKEALLDGLPYKDEMYDTVFSCQKCGAESIGSSSYCKSCGRPVGCVLSTKEILAVEVI